MSYYYYVPLSEAEKNLLVKVEKAKYKMEEFPDIASLREAKGYKVVACNWQSFVEAAEREISYYEEYGCSELELGLKEILHREYTLLGLYRGHDLKYKSPVIYLFKDNIDHYARSNDVPPRYVLSYVYVHEAMHALYDSKNNCGFFHIHELEEAFAECGMLDFFTKTIHELPDGLPEEAMKHVERKQWHGPYEYGFGLALMNKALEAGDDVPGMMARYREISNWLPLQLVQKYQNKVRSLDRRRLGKHYDDEAGQCYELVKEILNLQHTRPAANLTAIPDIFLDGTWRDVVRIEQGQTLVPLLEAKSLNDLVFKFCQLTDMLREKVSFAREREEELERAAELKK